MKFDFFLNNISKIEKIIVNSSQAHLELAPKGRGVFSTKYKTTNTREAAVMPIIASVDGEAHLTLINRTTYDGAHSGQVAFAGGKTEEEDNSLLETAFREVEEEIGVDRSKLIYARPLTSIYVPVSDFWVFPFLAFSKKKLVYTPQVSEVARVITLPLKTLIADDTKTIATVTVSENTTLEVPAFVYKDYTIWGATSMILNELKQIIVKSME